MLARMWGNAQLLWRACDRISCHGRCSKPTTQKDSLRQRWHLARTFSAAGLVEWLRDDMAMLWVPFPSPPLSFLPYSHLSQSDMLHFHSPVPPECKEAEGLVCFISGQMDEAGPSIKCAWRDKHIFFVFPPIKLDVE